MSQSNVVDSALIGRLGVDGLAVVPAVLGAAEVSLLRQELESAVEACVAKWPTAFDRGMVHNCMVHGRRMCALLDHPVLNAYLAEIMSPTCIMYAYQSSSLMPGQSNYGSRVHVDSPRFIPGYSTNLGVIFPLNDFTVDNGATWYLKGSHRVEEVPDEASFRARAVQTACSAGDMILFEGRLAHAAGVNRTEAPRHALTINICRSYMRQRFDFPRLVPQEIIDRLGPDGRRLIGMNVRMPTGLEEFYLPPEQRLYKPNQG